MNTEPTPPADDEDDGLPIHLAPIEISEIPAFCERLLTHLETHDEQGEFTFEGVDIDVAQAIWLAPLAGYLHEANATMDPADIDRELPTHGFGGYAQIVAEWAESARRALHDAWGEPQIREPRVVGDEQEPEGILDYVMIVVGIQRAELWDRGSNFVALVTDWDGEPGTSNLRQIALVIPRALVLGGMAAALDSVDMADEHLMCGENLVELHRRAWILSYLFGTGEERVRGTSVSGLRLNLQSRAGVTTVWTFTDDGRALLLLHEPECAFVTDAPAQFITDHTMSTAPDGADALVPSPEELREAHAILVARMLAGVPEDLRELITAPSTTSRGETGTQPLEFVSLGDQTVPLISAVVWYENGQWRLPPGMFDIGMQNGMGIDDFGFSEALRRPYHLGGSFTAELLTDDAGRLRRAEELFAACPYPEQPRPEGDAVLGNAIPRGASFAELAEQMENASAAWWDKSPDTVAFNDHTFIVGGRKLGHDNRAISTVLAIGERWTTDVFAAWSNSLIAYLIDRWGQPDTISVTDQNGNIRRSPVTRTMRSMGVHTGPLWWVNGNAVVLLGGIPETDSAMDPDPLCAIIIARPDAVLDVMRGTRWWELRPRARLLSELSQIANSTTQPGRPSVAVSTIPWAGTALPGSDVVPDAMRGSFRVDDRSWCYVFTHGARALLFSHRLTANASMPTLQQQRELFAGVPDDLLSLVVNRDPGYLYPLATGSPSGGGTLAAASSLPAVDTVLWLDDGDWRLSDGMLNRHRPTSMGTGDDVSRQDGFATYLSQDTGINALAWALSTGYENRTSEELADIRFASHVFSRPIEPWEAEQAIAALGESHIAAILGSLNQLLDVIADNPGGRYLLDAALSNPYPLHRRDIALWLMRDDMPDIRHQLSHLTPVNVLCENPTLGPADEVVLARLLAVGASPFAGATGAADPLAQLDRRAQTGAQVAGLRAQLIAAREATPNGTATP